MKQAKPKEKMYECEVKAPYQTQNGIEYRWKRSKVELTADTDQVRCAHCSGAVRFHRQRKTDGVADHVEHLSRQDSENCKGGYYFKGVHSRSMSPVL
jgi:hypothetical protein